MQCRSASDGSTPKTSVYPLIIQDLHTEFGWTHYSTLLYTHTAKEMHNWKFTAQKRLAQLEQYGGKGALLKCLLIYWTAFLIHCESTNAF